MTGIYECIDIILVNRHQEYKKHFASSIDAYTFLKEEFDNE